MSKRFSTVMAVLLLGLHMSWAGGVIVITQSSFSDPTDTSNMTVRVEDDRMRIDTEKNGKIEKIIFRGDKQLMWIIDSESKTYRELSVKEMEDVSKQLSDAQKRMEEQLSQLPPEQREMMKKMMEQQGVAFQKVFEQPPVEKTIYTLSKSGQQVGQWVTDQYVGKVKGKTQEEVWLAKIEQMKLQKEFNTLSESMSQFFQKMFKKMPISQVPDFGIMDAKSRMEEGLGDGFPVQTINYVGGVPTHKSTVHSIKEERIPASFFEVPAGYEKKRIMEE